MTTHARESRTTPLPVSRAAIAPRNASSARAFSSASSSSRSVPDHVDVAGVLDRVVGVGAHPERRGEIVDATSLEARGLEHDARPVGIGEPERTRGTRLRGRERATPRHGIACHAEPLVPVERLPHHERETAARGHRPPEVGEGGDRIAEEHHPEAAHDEVGRPGVNGCTCASARANVTLSSPSSTARHAPVRASRSRGRRRGRRRRPPVGRTDGWSRPYRSRRRGHARTHRHRGVEQSLGVGREHLVLARLARHPRHRRTARPTPRPGRR